jgi:adenosylhomocysteine nucleosidase
MNIVIITAMPEEYKAVAASLGLSVRGVGRGDVGRISAFGHNYELALSGMGFDNAARTAEQLLRSEAPDLLISTGFCGAVAQELQVGDVVVARSLVVSNELGFDEVPVMLADVGQTFVARQSMAGGRVCGGTFVSTSKVVAKQVLARIVPPHCQNSVVEMESSAVALVAGEHGIPLVAIRAVSDDAGEELCFSLDEFCDRDLLRIKPVKVLLTVLKRPTIIPQLFRLSRNSSLAAVRLQTALTSLFVQLQGASGC